MKIRQGKFLIVSACFVSLLQQNSCAEWTYVKGVNRSHSIESSETLEEVRISSHQPGVIDVDYGADGRIDLQLDSWPISLSVLGKNSTVSIEGPILSPNGHTTGSEIVVVDTTLPGARPVPGSHVTVNGEVDALIWFNLDEGGSASVQDVTANDLTYVQCDGDCPITIDRLDAPQVFVRKTGTVVGEPIVLREIDCQTLSISNRDKNPIFLSDSVVEKQLQIIGPGNDLLNAELENVLASDLDVIAYRDKEMTITLGDHVEIHGDTRFSCRGGSRLVWLHESALVHDVFLEADGGVTDFRVAGIVDGDMQIRSDVFAHTVKVAQKGFTNVFSDWEGIIMGDLEISSQISLISGYPTSAQVVLDKMNVQGSIDIFTERIPQRIITTAVLAGDRVTVDLAGTGHDVIEVTDCIMGDVDFLLGRGDDEVTLDTWSYSNYHIDGGLDTDTVWFDLSAPSRPDLTSVEWTLDLN